MLKPKLKKRTYVYVVIDTDGEVFLNGIYENFYEALGHLFYKADEQRETMNEEDGDEFYMSPLEESETESGLETTVRWRYSGWANPVERRHILLYNDEYERVTDDGTDDN